MTHLETPTLLPGGIPSSIRGGDLIMYCFTQSQKHYQILFYKKFFATICQIHKQMVSLYVTIVNKTGFDL